MSQHKILVVEDSPYDTELITRAFKKHLGDRALVFSVRTAFEALDYMNCSGEFAARNPLDFPDLIILDLAVPGLDGFEFLRAVKGSEQSARIPVVIFTGSSGDENVRKSHLLGASSYIVKPHDPNEFSALFSNLITYWLKTIA